MRYSSPEDAARPYEDQTPPRKKSKLPLILLGLVAVLVIVCSGIILTAFNTDSTNGVEPTSTSPSPGPPVAASKAKAAPESTAPKAVTIPAGTWVVGEELPAGKYRTPGAEEGFMEFCTWTVTGKGGDGDLIDAGSVGSVEEPARVTLKKGQAFKTSGCQDWVKQ